MAGAAPPPAELDEPAHLSWVWRSLFEEGQAIDGMGPEKAIEFKANLCILTADGFMQYLKFHFDIEPYSIWIKREQKKWYDFITTLMAMLGACPRLGGGPRRRGHRRGGGGRVGGLRGRCGSQRRRRQWRPAGETKRRRRGLLDRAEQGLLAPGPAGGASSSSSGLPPPQVEVLASGVMTQTLSRPDLFDAPTLEEQLEVQRREQARSAAAAPPQPPLVAAAASLTSRVRSPAGVDAGDSDIFRDDIPAARVHDRMAWTPEEEQRLVEGQRRFGNRWETVRTTCNLRHRTGSQLREKFRNLQRAGVV
ncbi:unnamed protein product [Prorocentrum cordatum]|uniref:Myb-like domain-containing protein n=1 Tax=Prorocentrum cordatum TaxID=2364126 RepID=A0ABN9TQI0_9DINO|nr:unnamed protein product [Polarella glacialis]